GPHGRAQAADRAARFRERVLPHADRRQRRPRLARRQTALARAPLPATSSSARSNRLQPSLSSASLMESGARKRMTLEKTPQERITSPARAPACTSALLNSSS